MNFNKSSIPAVTHVDYSARIQTVNQQQNPLFYQLISGFHRETGCPLVLNTSFNTKDEPIVCSPQDALEAFERSDLDVLVMGSFIIEKD